MIPFLNITTKSFKIKVLNFTKEDRKLQKIPIYI